MRSAGLIILAAGGSNRMGRPKQLLPWREGTLLRHAARTALSTPCRPVVVVLGCEEEACRRELAGLDVNVATNEHWSSGQGGSLAAGIRVLQAHSPAIEAALVMLVDQPGVTTEYLNELLQLWEAGHAIAATRYEESGGVPAVFDRCYFTELASLSGDRGARGLIAREARQTALAVPALPLKDLDTLDDYQRHAQA
jgi:molybdenum cofactor cytidylyltransferase